MSTLRWTAVQRRIHAALSSTEELSNAQVAEAAKCSEEWASRVLTRFEREGLAVSRKAQDARDPQTTYRLWKRTKKAAAA